MDNLPLLILVGASVISTMPLSCVGPELPVQSNRTVLATERGEPVEVRNSVCVPLSESESVHRPTRKPVFLMLRQVKATGESGGPFAVYLEPAGSATRHDFYRVGYFSLYSLPPQKAAPELSFALTEPQIQRLFRSPPASLPLQVCVENRSPDRTGATGAAVSFRQAVVTVAEE